MRLFILSVFIFNFASFALAQERGVLKGEFSRFYTSDDLNISKHEFSYLNNRRNLFWTYPAEEETAVDIGAFVTQYSGGYKTNSFESQQAQLYLGKKWGFKNYTYLKAGGHKFEYEDTKTEMLTYEISHEAKFYTSQLKISFVSDFQFIDQQIPLPLEEGLKREVFQLNYEYKKDKQWRFPILAKKVSISDGNHASQIDLAALYGGVYPVWWWIGYSVAQLSYDERKSGYWSPEKFTSHGPRLEVSYPFTQWWQGIIGYNYSFIKEDDFEAGSSSYSNLGIEYGKRDDGLIQLLWVEIISEQASNEWSSKGYLLTFEKSL
ncbi:MAG: hypothetical protein HON90_03265 [Halobacteriovoraceae bacterium]|jgi:hypothetical protein|nr:hypothetical protein [Halobacteriovoraceae bacterium]